MKLQIDWRQRSTIRGAIWLIGGIIALFFSWFGKDAIGVMAITASVAGGIGVVVKD